jgi:hypothetical protein
MSDFKDRLQAEKEQLDDRLQKLNGFIGTENFNKIKKDQQTLLNIQSSAMETYLKCLNERLVRL